MLKALALLVICPLLLLAQMPKPGSGTGGGGSVSLSGTTDGAALCNIGGVLADCPPGSYAATIASNTTWTITGATHNLETCDLTANTWTVSGGLRTWAVGEGMECDEDDYDVRITWGASATAGRVVLIKGGGGGPGGGGAGDVVGPASATADAIALYNGTTGKLIKDSAKAVPTGTIVGTSDTQTLTNKTLTLPFIGAYTVAGLPAAGTANRLAVVTDAATSGSCTSGSGSSISLCRDSGSAWVPLGDGSTSGLPSLGTAYQILRVNAAAGALEYVTLQMGTGLTRTPSSGAETLSTDCAQIACLGLNNAFLGNNAFAGTTVQTPSATQTLVAGDAITVSTVTFKSISAGSAITLTSTPTIANGSPGQELILVNEGATNSITIQDEANLAGSNLCLPADTNITIASGDAVRMVFSDTRSCWIAFR